MGTCATVAAALLSATWAAAGFAQDGAFDPTFGFGGSTRVSFDLPGTDFHDEAHVVAVQPNGGLILGGFASEASEGTNSALVGLTAEGGVDSGFGGGPFTFGDVRDESVEDLLVEPSGSVLVASRRLTGSTFSYIVERRSPAGAYESGVGLAATTGVRPRVRLARDPVSGKLLVAMTVWNGSSAYISVVRLAADLQLDFTYGNGSGELQVQAPPDLSTYLSDIETLADGSLIVASFVRTAGGGHDFLAARASQAGVLDSAFGVQGLSQIPLDLVVDGSDRVAALAVDAVGRILLGGSAAAPGSGDDAAVLVRLTAGGAVDSSFNNHEPLIVADTDGDDAMNGVVVQSDGRIVVAGKVFGPASPMFFAARFLEDGSADWSFGSFGVFTAHFPNSPNDDYAVALALQGGRPILVGPAEWNAPDYDFGVMRLTSSLIFADDLERGSTAGWSLRVP